MDIDWFILMLSSCYSLARADEDVEWLERCILEDKQLK